MFVYCFYKLEKNRENNLKSITEKGQKAADDVRKYQNIINDKQQELEVVNAEIAKCEEKLKEKKEVIDSIPREMYRIWLVKSNL